MNWHNGVNCETHCYILLYKPLVCSHLEYANSVWLVVTI